MTDVTVSFSHPLITPPLNISTGANEITWGYGLNYQTYPTYGGEVVQILSAYTEDLVIQGEVRTYTEMEAIAEWFLRVLQVSTQGSPNDHLPPFDPSPVTFVYPARGWTQQIVVTEMPGFKYGRDVVVPQYQIKAHVVEQSTDLNSAVKTLLADVVSGTSSGAIDLVQFGRVTAGIGFRENDPFSDPFPKLKKSEMDTMTQKLYQQIGSYYNTFVSSYADGDFSGETIDYSRPAFLAGGSGTKGDPNVNAVGKDLQSKPRKSAKRHSSQPYGAGPSGDSNASGG